MCVQLIPSGKWNTFVFKFLLTAIPRFITTLGQGEYPLSGSPLEDLINRSSLMGVPFRSMQLQNELLYLGALEDPSATVSDINMQSYMGRNTTYYLNFKVRKVSKARKA